jgi:4-hydroxybenzoate polyprenyltransferase
MPSPLDISATTATEVTPNLDKDLIPLVVDLDGTLTPSDSLWETLWWITRKHPQKLVGLLPKLILGRPKFKREVINSLKAEHHTEVIQSLPWNKSIVKFLNQEHKRGRDIYLATASDEEVATLVKKKFPFIKEALGSNPKKNLKGTTKAKILVEKFGTGGFDYIGNDMCDIAIWREANKVLIASNLLKPLLQKRISSKKPIFTIFTLKERRIKIFIRALRVKQWSKNLLVFAPMIASHAYLDPEKWWLGLLTFLSFCLCASGAYMLNDLIDIENDRKHHKKKSRPIAEGHFPIPLALILSVTLPILGLILAMPLGVEVYILIYLLSTILYSTILKKVAIVDIACLAGLYCLRIITGGVATSEPVSFWMAAFGGFLFVSLACVKRQAELLNIKKTETPEQNTAENYAQGRDYSTNDIALTRNIGVSTGCIAPLVLALYLEGNSGEQFYAHPEYLWGSCGLIFIWIMSLWRDTEAGKVKEEDPISYSITNKKSILLLLLLGCTLILATYVP